MHLHFEFADSEVAQCVWQERDLHVRFAAAQLQPSDAREAERVWAPMVMVLHGVHAWEVVDTSACIGRLNQGVVLHASQRLQRLPVPCHLQGVVTLELDFAQAGLVHVRCADLSLLPVESEVVSAYQC